MGDAGPGGEDRTDVARSVTAESDGPFQGADQGVAAVGGFEGGELVEVGSERAVPGCRCGLDERDGCWS